MAIENNNEIIDIKISGIHRKRFRIDGDDNKILELNTSDINIASRLTEAYPQLEELQKDYADIGETLQQISKDSPTIDDMKAFSKKFNAIDTKMRELVDYIFNSNVSEICASDGSMYDPVDGYHRYEVIINSLASLYNQNLDKEIKKIKKRMETHTQKYVKK